MLARPITIDKKIKIELETPNNINIINKCINLLNPKLPILEPQGNIIPLNHIIGSNEHIMHIAYKKFLHNKICKKTNSNTNHMECEQCFQNRDQYICTSIETMLLYQTSHTEPTYQNQITFLLYKKKFNSNEFYSKLIKLLLIYNKNFSLQVQKIINNAEIYSPPALAMQISNMNKYTDIYRYAYQQLCKHKLQFDSALLHFINSLTNNSHAFTLLKPKQMNSILSKNIILLWDFMNKNLNTKTIFKLIKPKTILANNLQEPLDLINTPIQFNVTPHTISHCLTFAEALFILRNDIYSIQDQLTSKDKEIIFMIHLKSTCKFNIPNDTPTFKTFIFNHIKTKFKSNLKTTFNNINKNHLLLQIFSKENEIIIDNKSITINNDIANLFYKLITQFNQHIKSINIHKPYLIFMDFLNKATIFPAIFFSKTIDITWNLINAVIKLKHEDNHYLDNIKTSAIDIHKNNYLKAPPTIIQHPELIPQQIYILQILSKSNDYTATMSDIDNCQLSSNILLSNYLNYLIGEYDDCNNEYNS
ncbi:MAG: hypothetical protein AAFO15_01615 [Pseudomonadota bacterium]